MTHLESIAPPFLLPRGYNGPAKKIQCLAGRKKSNHWQIATDFEKIAALYPGCVILLFAALPLLIWKQSFVTWSLNIWALKVCEGKS